MKKNLLILLSFLLMIITAGCSNDDYSNAISHKDSCISGDALLYKEIMGEWKLIKAIPDGNTLMGINYFCFYSDGSSTYHFAQESKTYQGKFEIVERDNWKVSTIDYKSIPTNLYLRLYRDADYYEDFPFVIDGSKMHINVWGFTYTYTAFMFERIK
ncbi:MAG: hypothetical protein IJL54_07545 [Prevotella sp.]|nr:hypothetical protein [Prevotella sp.]